MSVTDKIDMDALRLAAGLEGLRFEEASLTIAPIDWASPQAARIVREARRTKGRLASREGRKGVVQVQMTLRHRGSKVRHVSLLAPGEEATVGAALGRTARELLAA